MDCKTCPHGPDAPLRSLITRWDSDHPCNFCPDSHIAVEQITHIDEKRQQYFRHLDHKSRKRITLTQWCAVVLFMVTVVYVAAHMVAKAWGS